MGSHTDYKIRSWQGEHGITPARGEYASKLDRMSELAYQLIQLIALEKSGIRDGDGHWYGCDPLNDVACEIGVIAKATAYYDTISAPEAFEALESFRGAREVEAHRAT